MRPLLARSIDSSIYSEVAQLARVVGRQDAADDRPARAQPVEDVARAAQVVLATHWFPNLVWDDDEQRQRCERAIAAMGDGFLAAVPALIEQFGSFCGFCEAPVIAAPRPVQLLPTSRFPTTAFALDNLLLACPACAAIKGERPDPPTAGQDSAAAADALRDPRRFAWPTRYPAVLGESAALPYRCDLAVVRRDGDELVRVRLVLPDEVPGLLTAWREGQVVERRGLVERDAPRGTRLAVLLAPSGPDVGLRAGVQALIDLLRLNDVVTDVRAAAGDRRVAMRTRAWLRALETRERLDAAARAGDVAFDAVVDAVVPAVAATGFWCVWRTVLADLPGVDALLARAFPGAPPTRWSP
jgi:hypothetical protein